MKFLWSTYSFQEAKILEGILDLHNIPYVELGGHLNGLIGGLPYSEGHIQIFVPSSVWEEAFSLCTENLPE